MAGSIPPLRPAIPPTQSTAESASVTGAAHATPANGAPAPSIGNRLLMRLGLKTSAADEKPLASRFSQSQTHLSLSLPAPDGLSEAKPVGDVRAIEKSIRARLTSLPEAAAERYRQALDSTLQTGGSMRQLGILKMLEANVKNAGLRNADESPGAKSWRSLSQTSVGINFERSVADLSKMKTAELTALKTGIASLPTELSEQYQALLSDILAFGKPADRNSLLSALTQDVAARLKQDK